MPIALCSIGQDGAIVSAIGSYGHMAGVEMGFREIETAFFAFVFGVRVDRGVGFALGCLLIVGLRFVSNHNV